MTDGGEHKATASKLFSVNATCVFKVDPDEQKIFIV